jgi:hypothetical protein
LENRRLRHECTPDDLDRMDRVHGAVMAHPEAFKRAAAKMDTDYSASKLYEIAAQQRQRLQEAANGDNVPRKAISPAMREVYAELARLFLPPEIPRAQLGKGREWWNQPFRRWSVAIAHHVSSDLPISLPGLEWEQPAKAILMYWVACDRRAEEGPRLSEFQEWKWYADGTFGRELARSDVSDWQKVNRAVDFARAVAARTFLKRPGLEASRVGGAAHPAARPSGSTELTVDLIDPENPKLIKLGLRYGIGPDDVPLVALVKGRTQAHLAKMVIEQPDMDHTWRALTQAGNRTQAWLITSPASLERAGRRVWEQLPARLRGHWTQGTAGVRWNTR